MANPGDIRITQSNLIGFVTVPADENDGTSDKTLPTVFEEGYFSINLYFEVASDDGSGDGTVIWTEAEDVDIILSNPVVSPIIITKVSPVLGASATVRISGNYSGYEFPGQEYLCKMVDGSIQDLDPSTTEEFQGLIHYIPPSVFSVDKDYIASVYPTSEDDPTILTIDQWVHWNYATAVASVQNMVHEGKY